MNFQNALLKATALAMALGWLTHQRLQASDWPQWRGPDRTDRSDETGLLKTWPAGGPKQVWLFKNAGIGYSGFSVVKGVLYTMGAREQQEYLIALDASTGAEKWSTPIGDTYSNNWGDGPRGTPTVDGDRVYALSAKGSLVAAQASDGKVLWKHTMEEFGGKLPGWGFCESVLVEGDKVIATPGGSKGALVALNKNSGALIWQSSSFTDEAHYSSTLLASLNGKRQIIQLTPKNVVGINSEDGATLWQSPWGGKVAVIPSPIFHNNHVYITSGYGVGCKLVKIGPDNQVSDVYENKVMKNHHGGVILVGDYLYGHSDGAGWVCQNFMTGTEVWSTKQFGKGAVTYADGKLYCLEEGSGTVALVDASPTSWVEHGRFTLAPQTTLRKKDGRIWTHPVISGGKLYLRDQEIIYCYNIKAQ